MKVNKRNAGGPIMKVEGVQNKKMKLGFKRLQGRWA